VNVGDTKADECQLVFVGPPRFMPFDNVTNKSIGTMQVGDTVTYEWKMIPLRRDVGGTESLVFQVHGKGGLGNRIIVGECKVDIYVPPARSAEYSCVVAAPDAITFDAGNGTYQPDPFTFTTTVTNIGLADGMGLSATILLPPGMILANGQAATINFPDLPVGNSSAPLQWLVRPVARKVGADLTITVQIKDRFGKTKECSKSVYVPPAPDPGLGIVCNTELTALEVDKLRGQYKQSVFYVTAKISNTSGRPVNNVYVSVLPQSNELKVIDDQLRFVAVRLDPNVTTDTIRWNVYAVPRSQTGNIEIKFYVSGDGVPTQECSQSVYVPEIGRPILNCMTTTTLQQTASMVDTLHFDGTIGDYEGTKSTHGKYNVFTVTTTVDNLAGFAQATGVKATLLPPAGVTLDEGENAIKFVKPQDIIIGGNSTVSWNIRPLREAVGQVRRFTIVLTSDNADEKSDCIKDVFIQGAPKVINLTLPDDPVGSFGEKITVPVLIDETIGRDIYLYKLNIKFDPEAVRFIEPVSTNSLTERGWNGARVKLYNIPDASGTTLPNMLRIEDYTTGTPMGTHRTGALVYLRFEAIQGGTGKEFKVLPTDLTFVPTVTVTENGMPKTLVTSMNSVDDAKVGDVIVVTKDGHITVSGECIIPLSTSRNDLAQNKPNPFNPTTLIEYELAEETDYTITLYDALGRNVETVVQGHAKAGKHSVLFDARELPSGTYMYKLETPKFTKIMRMVLAR
jgi:hypothetical protein